jgi:DnaJ-class molecular chaperone
MDSIKVNGHAFPVVIYGDYIRVKAGDCAKAARQIVKSMGLKAKVRTETTGSIYIKLAYGTPKEMAEKVREATRWLAGETFDGMTDTRETLTKVAEDGRKVYFGSAFVFVDIDYRAPEVA